MISNYLICATARSGSNVLCEVLSAVGFAGRPEEHLWHPEGMPPTEPLDVRWAGVIRSGTGPNGVFGLKLLWYQMEMLIKELPAALCRPEVGLTEILDESLDRPRYIRLARKDRLRQAISFARAVQSGRWRSTDVARGLERYDRTAIEHGLSFIAHEQRSWDAFFSSHGIEPHRVSYEDLESDFDRSVTEILRFLGYQGATIPLPPTVHRKQADAVTEEWARRYLDWRFENEPTL